MKLTGWHPAYEGSVISRSETVDFGVCDVKGRAVGGYASVVSTASEASAPANEWLVRTWSTRDGQNFGAIPRGTRVRGTEEQAKALAEEKLEAAKKRQVKQFGSLRAVAS